MIVYSLRCYTCSKQYIGSSIRKLHTRYGEHVDRQDGIINSHKRYCQFPNFIPNIMERIHGDDEQSLRIREALQIRNNKPTLNTKEELSKLLDFIL